MPKKNLKPQIKEDIFSWAFGYPWEPIGLSRIIHADCFKWLSKLPENSIHGMITDPPYGVKEYELAQIEKRENGHGGIWRLPPSFDGHKRSPLPRFTALNSKERKELQSFFTEWSTLAARCLRPGGHVIIASNSFLSQSVFSSVVEGGLEFRGELIRLVRTLRGGDRPKNAEQEFPEVVTMPRGCYEPWGVFRKPLPPGMTVSECLRRHQTGGLRRNPEGQPFSDVIASERTPQAERKIAPHPSLKPQSFLRQLAQAILPLGKGIIVDTFMGSGSMVAAALALDLTCIGIERHEEYYNLARRAIPRLSARKLSPPEVEDETRQPLLFPVS